MWMTTTHFRPGIYNRHIARTMTSLFLCPLYPVSSDCFSLNFFKNLFQLGYMFIYEPLKTNHTKRKKSHATKRTNPTQVMNPISTSTSSSTSWLYLSSLQPFKVTRQCWWKTPELPAVRWLSGILQMLKVPSNVSQRLGGTWEAPGRVGWNDIFA